MRRLLLFTCQVVAGTEAVFPALSEVFSPIPRQFHRVDVKPFARWLDTMEFVLHPILKELFNAVASKQDVLRELHELCGGAPDEVQLLHEVAAVGMGIVTEQVVANLTQYRDELRRKIHSAA